jgi:hypothetical protein
MKKLSRNELKNIKGGDGSGGNVTCYWSWAPGYQKGSSSSTSCSGSADWCQQQADNFCWAHDECTDVDCR